MTEPVTKTQTLRLTVRLGGLLAAGIAVLATFDRLFS